MRSAFCPATRVVRQWVKECQQSEGGETSTVSCFLHEMTQLGGPTLPQPRACTCAGFFLTHSGQLVAHVCWHAHSWARSAGQAADMDVQALSGVKFLSWWLVERFAKGTQDHPDDVMVCF